MKKKMKIYLSFGWLLLWILITYPFFWVSAITYRIAGMAAFYLIRNNLRLTKRMGSIIDILNKGLEDDYGSL